jgi:GT2 family glycosyltransferase
VAAVTRTAESVAVAISTRDRADALRRCLRSLADGRALPAEVVVADQSAGPDTRDAVDEYRDHALPVRHLRARPGGLGASQNDAVRATSAPVVAVIDDDCVASADWLERIEAAFDGEPGLALLGGRVLPLGPPAAGTYAVSSRVSAEPRAFGRGDLPWDVGSGNNFALRRTWFERIGGCDERLGPGAPLRGGLDMDLFHRVLRAGGRARYEPEVAVGHERTTRAGRLSRRRDYGFGTGAAVAIWLRSGDRTAWSVLASWIRMRTELLARAAARRRWEGVREEAIVLGATVQGLAAGLRMTGRSDVPG